jgi:ribonuclease PH
VSHSKTEKAADSLRPVQIETHVNIYAEGSALISMGNTRILCTCSAESRVPPFLRDSGEGWVTAEYSMLPRSTHTRSARESHRGKLGGRTMEIQRLIGRSLRSIVDRKILDGYTLTVDCDVLQADGGTRTAAITGGFVALNLACKTLMQQGKIKDYPIKDAIAAVSLGVVDGGIWLDLDYERDSKADVDLNLVMTGTGKLVEIQGTAEGSPFSREHLLSMLEMGEKGIRELCSYQERAVENSHENSHEVSPRA